MTCRDGAEPRSSAELAAQAKPQHSTCPVVGSQTRAAQAERGGPGRARAASPHLAVMGVPVTTHAWRLHSDDAMTAATEEELATSCASSSTTLQNPY